MVPSLPFMMEATLYVCQLVLYDGGYTMMEATLCSL